MYIETAAATATTTVIHFKNNNNFVWFLIHNPGKSLLLSFRSFRLSHRREIDMYV